MAHTRTNHRSGRPAAKRSRNRFLAILGSLALAALTAFVVDLVNKGTDRIVPTDSNGAVSSSSAPFRTECGIKTFLPEPIAKQVLSRPGPDRFSTIEDKPGAAPAGKGTVEASILGESDRAITITGISFKVHHMRRSPGATFTRACGGPLTGRAIEVDLDSSPPRILGTNAAPNAFLGEEKEDFGNAPLRVRPIIFPWIVSLRDPLQLYMIATTKSCYCGWQAELKWVSGAQRGTIFISNNGRDYLVAGDSGLRAYLGEPMEAWQTN